MDSIVANARAHTQADGSLLVVWDLEGEPAAVDIATGSTPQHLDHRHEVTVPAGQTSWRLAPTPEGRCFLSVTVHGGGPAVVTTDRRIAFGGISNFRDLGGYHTRLDGPVRWGLVFRADGLHGLLPEDLPLYEQLGVRTVYDLRGEEERTARPNRMRSRHLNVLSRPVGEAVLPERPDSADGERILADLYRGLIDHAAVQIGELFAGLAGDEGLPAVFHCHAGKDRTGVAAALLLEALGVDRADILDDYELTSRYRVRSQQEASYERLRESGLSPEAAAGVLATPRWAMEEALAHLDDRYCGVEEYLTGPARMRKEDLETLRARLIDPTR